jgi:hypothetical protein
MIEDPLSEEVLEGHFRIGDTVLIDCEDDKIHLHSRELVEV